MVTRSYFGLVRLAYILQLVVDLRTQNVFELIIKFQTNSREKCGDKMDAFLDRTYYINGGYDNREGMSKLNALMEQIEVKQNEFSHSKKHFQYNLEAVDY